jgi:hypothetical protein
LPISAIFQEAFEYGLHGYWSIPSSCKKILKHIAEAMTPDQSTCLVSDGIEPDKELSALFSAHQLHMISLLSRAYRSQDEWEILFLDVDERFLVEKIYSSGTGKVIFALRITEGKSGDRVSINMNTRETSLGKECSDSVCWIAHVGAKESNG